MSLINRHPVCTTLSNQESLVNLSAVSEGRAVGGCGLSTVLIHLAGTKLIWEIRSAIKEMYISLRNLFIMDLQQGGGLEAPI